MSLLDPTNVEQVEVRLHSVLQKLDKIAEKKNTQEDGEKQNKVSNEILNFFFQNFIRLLL
jgi:hypothetical protein